MTHQSEAEIQAAILVAVTALPGAMFWRASAGLFKNQRGGFVRANAVGCPDVLGVYQGRFVGIEVKTPAGRQSPAQKRFQAAVARAGGVYVLARSVAEALDNLQAIRP